MSRLSLAERVTAIEAALSDTPHAFGGALALAYYAEPRATIDIDLNVFVPPDHADPVLARLRRLGVDDGGAEVRDLIAGQGQARVMWDSIPVDLFFAYDAFHDAAAKARRTVPFGAGTISILGPDHLVVCKAVFNRPKDWVDIEAILQSGTELDVAEVARWVGRIAGDDDSRYERVVALLTRTRRP